MIADPSTKRLPLRSSSSFHALIMAAPEKQAMNLQQISDRTTAQKGATRLSDPSHIKIWFNAEPQEPTCCAKYALCCSGLAFDKERSYMYLREGALEHNRVNKCCIKALEPCNKQPDWISLQYFDKKPYAKIKKCGGFCSFDPYIEKVDNGCMICCTKVTCHQSCCGKDFMTYVPVASYCCCFPNRVNWCCNCCGLWGPPDGNPLIHIPYFMQPEDVDGFVAQCKQVIPAARAMHPTGA